MWIADRLEELKYSKNIYYGDELYILPFHMVTKENTFNDMKRIIVTSVDTDGFNNRGCEVTGKVVTYDENSYPVEVYYSGYAIYRVKNNRVITKKGNKIVKYENDVYSLTDECICSLYCRFKASENLFIQLCISGNYDVENSYNELSKNINIFRCLLYQDKIELFVNGVKIIFTDYSIIHDGIEYNTEKAKEELWLHMICNEIPYKQNKYKMDYSKVFLLKKEGFFIKRNS